MARFSVPNLRNYSSHLSRGVLLLIGALVIIALVAATYFYGSDRQATVNETPGQTQDQATGQTDEAETVGETDGTNEGTTTSPEDETEDETEGEAAGTAASQPDELANTGPALNYGLITMALVSLAMFYRQSSHKLEQAFKTK